MYGNRGLFEVRVRDTDGLDGVAQKTSLILFILSGDLMVQK